MPQPVPFTERDLRRQMVKVCQALSMRGLVAATDGNVSARSGPERILVTPSSTAKGEVTEGSILLCDLDGRKIRGHPRDRVSSEVQVHLAAYRARDEVGAVVHAHPPVASAFTFAGREDLLAQPVLPEVVAQVGPIITVPYMTPGTRLLAERAGEAFAESDVVMLAQHGAVTLGPDPWSAYLRMEKLEQTATILHTARDIAGGDEHVKRLAPEQIEPLVRTYGGGRMLERCRAAGWLPAEGNGTDIEEQIVERVAEAVLRRLKAGGS